MRAPMKIAMTRWLKVFLVALVGLGSSEHETFGMSLDRKGLIVAGPGYYVCHKDLQLVRAGWFQNAPPHQRLFEITLKTFCGVMPEWRLEGGASKFGPVNWVPVTITGSHDYDRRWAVEVIEVQEPKAKALRANVQCANNPWVTGQACQLKSLENHTAADANVPYPVSAVLLPLSLRTALQKWEAGQAKADELTDWNPGALKSGSPHAVATPNLGTTIPATATSFQLSLIGPAPTAPTVAVKLEWAELTAGKDPSIEPLAWHYDTPAAAPMSLIWSQLPRQVSITGVFSRGLYAVRAKVHTSPATDWQLFWVGPPDPQLAKYIRQGAPSADVRRAESSKLASGKLELSSLQQVILIGKGQASLVKVPDLPRLKAGVLQPAPGRATPRGTPTPPASPKPSP